MNKKPEITIIGGGPSGSFSAYLLTKYGFKVTILEASSAPKRKVCGEYLCPRGVSLLQQFGIFQHFETIFQAVTGMVIHSPSGFRMETTFPCKDGIQNGLSLNREVFDQTLLQLAQDAGSTVIRNQRVKKLERSSSGWKIETTDGARFETPLLIGADGRNSIVARSMNVHVRHPSKRVAIHCNLPTSPRHLRKGEMHLFPSNGYIGINPIHECETNLSLVCDAQEIRSAGSPRNLLIHYLSQSEALRDRFLPLPDATEIATIAPLRHIVRNTSGEGWCLIGDAGGFLDPLTGEGIFQALSSAAFLSKAFQMESERNAPDWNHALKVYSRNRKRMFRSKTRINQVFQWIIRHPDSIERLARYLNKNKRRPDAFIGLIGNVYNPFEGLLRIITA